VFVEVKSRAEDALYQPREAVTPEKQRRIIKSALLYNNRYPNPRQIRFDVIEVVTDKTAPVKALEIRHIENAYGG
jgi:putative endonuclease